MIADEVRAMLASHGTVERATHEKAYMKSSLEFLGVPVPVIRREANAFSRQHPSMNVDMLRQTVDALWTSNVFELRSFAIGLLGCHSSLLGQEDLDWLKGLIVDASCWAHVDWLSTEALSDIVKRDQDCLITMDRWAVDPCFWVRRASILSLLILLRKGDLTEWPRFCRYAVPMLEEKEFFIRKAIGWVLRETSKKNPDVIRSFVKEHQSRMSGLTLREATKWL